ncbi:hypothetical protein INQ51_10410 [Maribellus sp. CM-23]|uniref:contractile injection system tape measure protein n=1 Tax=Maribellus sp. CM-23 TaxID=2781026 RepID=UPI001EEEA72D|nr:contractile injection system tape measure protein [Maribellus sp. CM-23]MCE4564723.1 hypothetical protein [Maribellus sp. CM-23]
MGNSEHIIHNSSIQLEYKNKAMAIRCNQLIESIFHSHVLPEMEAAVSASIPAGINIELSKLEIHIGEIPEKELRNVLGQRIRAELEKSLNFSQLIDFKGSFKNGSKTKKLTSDNALLYALDFFLQNGFFPYSLANNPSINDLLAELVGSHPKELSEVLLNHKSGRNKILRLIHHLSPQNLNKVVVLLEPANAVWIEKLVPRLLDFAEHLKVNHSQKELYGTLMASIFHYLRNNRSPGFSRQRFIESVLKDWLRKSVQSSSLTVTGLPASKFKDQDERLIFEAFEQIRKNKTHSLEEASKTGTNTIATENEFREQKQLSVPELIHILHNGTYINHDTSWLRGQLVSILQNPENNKILGTKLDERSTHLLLRLLEKEQAESITGLLHRLYQKTVKDFDTKIKFNHLVLNTLKYLSETGYHPKKQEKFVVRLLLQTDADLPELTKNSSFQEFFRDEKFSSIKWAKALREVAIFRDDAKILSSDKSEASNERPQSKQKSIVEKPENYLLVYYRKILGIYLQQGYLPEGFEALTRNDLQQALMILCEKNDDLLAKVIRLNKTSEDANLNLFSLIDTHTATTLQSYLSRFFPKENKAFTQIISELSKHSGAKQNSLLLDPVFLAKLFIAAMEESSESKDPEAFTIKIVPALFAKTSDKQAEKYLIDLLKKSMIYSRYDTSPIEGPKPVSERMKSYFNHRFELLIAQLNTFIQKTPDNKKLSEEMAVSSIAFPSHFIDCLLQYPNQLTKLHRFFKLNLDEKLWTKMEERIWSDFRVKEYVMQYTVQAHWADSLMNKTDAPTSNTEKPGELSESEFSALIFRAEQDRSLVGKLVASEKGLELIRQLKFSNKKINTLLEALYEFGLSTPEARIASQTWKSIQLKFAFFLVENELPVTSSELGKTYTYFLFEQLKTHHREEHFFSILKQLQDSHNSEIQNLVKLWYAAEQIQPAKNSKDENPTIVSPEKTLAEKTDFYLSVLRFYSHANHLPWWSGVASATELLFELNSIWQESSSDFAEHLLTLDKDEQIFASLSQNVSPLFIQNFESIVYKHPRLSEAWEQVQKKTQKEQFSETQDTEEQINKANALTRNAKDFLLAARTDENLLRKGLYSMGDSELISHWPDQRSEVKTLLSEYLSLTPFFYFREITPVVWRESVYKFSLRYFTQNSSASTRLFHNRLLAFLQETQRSVDWKNILSSVYARVKQYGASKNVVFPAELLRLLPDEASHTIKNGQTIIHDKMETSDSISGVTTRISNSGLVLGWPFMSRLFESLQYTEQGRFVSEEYQNRAVYLLQYLVFNDTGFPEYELVLNKLLAGIPAEKHLDPVEELSTEEKTTAQSLLFGMIHNWEKVSNSTPEGIQETFLQREGMLSFNEDFYQLKVEKKGVDVLMQTIPWKFNTIKLAWMDKPIHVDWI